MSAPAKQTDAGAQLRQYIERIERLDEERKSIGADIRDVFSEAKSAGFDPKVMRLILRLRKMEPNQRQEEEALLELYKDQVGL